MASGRQLAQTSSLIPLLKARVMAFESRRQSDPIFQSHQRQHEAVLKNEAWFGDGPPYLGKQFTAAKANERKAIILDLLYREAKHQGDEGQRALADRLGSLADKLFDCRRHRRCGSLACTKCARAFQRAKTAAQAETIKALRLKKAGKQLVMATVIPLSITFRPDQLHDLNVRNLNRLLKDRLSRSGFRRVMMGSGDFSWDAARGVYQYHWHIVMFTSNRKKLQRKIKSLFPGLERGDRPVVISKTYSLKFLSYKNKAIKIVELLKSNRRGLPYLLLALDSTEPLELMVLSGVRVSAQEGGLIFKKIQRR